MHEGGAWGGLRVGWEFLVLAIWGYAYKVVVAAVVACAPSCLNVCECVREMSFSWRKRTFRSALGVVVDAGGTGVVSGAVLWVCVYCLCVSAGCLLAAERFHITHDMARWWRRRRRRSERSGFVWRQAKPARRTAPTTTKQKRGYDIPMYREIVLFLSINQLWAQLHIFWLIGLDFGDRYLLFQGIFQEYP